MPRKNIGTMPRKNIGTMPRKNIGTMPGDPSLPTVAQNDNYTPAVSIFLWEKNNMAKKLCNGIIYRVDLPAEAGGAGRDCLPGLNLREC